MVRNEASETRLAIARRVVDLLSARTELKASMLTGSAALGISDQHSDIDLLNYYDRLPAPGLFDEVIRGASAQAIAPIGSPGPEGFLARYRIDGIEVQTGGQLIDTLERRLERVQAGDVDWINAKMAMGLLEGVPLYGEALVRGWQSSAAYPEALRRREVEANLGFFPIWAVDEQLAARDAELFRRQMLLDGAFRLLAVLSALNRLYFTTFQFKRSRDHIGHMALKPGQLGERLDLIANGSPQEAAAALRELVVETRELVAEEMPEVNVEVAWQPRP